MLNKTLYLLFIFFNFSLVFAEGTFQPSYRMFDDWVVACNNTGGCTLQSINEENTFEFTLYRSAGKNGAILLALYNGQNEFATGSLNVDGFPTNIDGTKIWNIYENEKQRAADSELLLRLVDRIRNGTQLQWYVEGSAEANLSLKGFTAGLLYIDELQKRLSTPTAFIRRGNQSVNSIPNTALPVVPKKYTSSFPELTKQQNNKIISQVIKSQSEMLKKEDCSIYNTETSRLNQTEAIVLIECWRGAYQSTSLAFLTPIEQPNKARQLVLTLPNVFLDNKIRKVEAFTEVHFDPETKRLFSAAKFRGLADCGESIEWQFDGKDFQLINWNYLENCTGQSPGNWPYLILSND